ncbi:heart- and neural crest derivatives-expressed protein 2-like [Cylas formicarius]|uniref:heart- and neural crest derivatives-expressed protein 2-like n=1 Tax=Cylas formicarius TaxID=197179 RepID=UPI0029588C8B|nr:heart- and neural crest derivatives-expressed protein 2-like [Cylas formicarius]
MSYSNSTSDHDAFQYGYTHNSHHYISDGSTIGGDESNFWSNSPSRTDSPSPNILHAQNQIENHYQIYAPSSCPTSHNHYSPYRTNYTSITSDPDLGTPFVRVVKRRTTANKKERRRTQSINNSYAMLRDCIPNVPADTKLSKIKTLRLAKSYISYLTRALETDDTVGGFKAELGSLSRKSNSNNQIQINSESLNEFNSHKSDSSEETNNCRKAKGRTGWPQHVWASELKQEQGL